MTQQTITEDQATLEVSKESQQNSISNEALEVFANERIKPTIMEEFSYRDAVKGEKSEKLGFEDQGSV
ncbi:hypothetical protein RJT34_14733 [Clitoria ternatea]|uniref:Uncharacterized protein n=1 Tax=Clitoria ternatea TaxID=43366 RepID=A0AAN9PMP9_CLITE